jgi:hypothetical protein
MGVRKINLFLCNSYDTSFTHSFRFWNCFREIRHILNMFIEYEVKLTVIISNNDTSQLLFARMVLRSTLPPIQWVPGTSFRAFISCLHLVLKLEMQGDLPFNS